MKNVQIQNLINLRLFTVFILGFVSGLPLLLTGSTLQAWFTSTNVDLKTIGALSLLGLPYTLKFLWAPLMDYFSIPLLGKRRGWILVSQVGTIAALLLLANMQPSSQASGMALVALMISFFSASQDIAIDAYRTNVLHASERGVGGAYYVMTYRIACLVAGGIALVMADHLGWKLTYQIMAGMLTLSLFSTIIAPNTLESNGQPTHFIKSITDAIKDILQRDKVVLLLLFLLLYKFGDALALQLMTNFLLHTLGFSLTEVGFAYKVVGFIATMAGVLLGGVLLVRLEIYTALLWFGLLQAISNIMFVILAMCGKQYLLMICSVFVENFCGGLSTAALFAFLMTLCRQQYAATQFAIFSAMTSLGRVLLGPLAAFLVNQYGWVQFYFYSFLTGFLGLAVLLLIRSEVVAYVPVQSDI